MTRRLLLCPLAAAAAVLLSACGSSWAASTAATTSRSTAPASTARVAATATAMDVGDPTDIPAAPSWNAAAAESARQAAGDAVTRYLRKDLDPAHWWAQVADTMTPSAQIAYAQTWPENVPGTAIIGWPAADPGPTTHLATAMVPTDAGPYVLLLSWGPDSGSPHPWLVEKITPPTR